MPRIWHSSNSSSEQDAVRNEIEINAVAAYAVRQQRASREFAVKNPPRGDAQAGEKVVKAIGCQGCHVVGEGTREAAGPRRTFGQPLENIGNKTTYEWVFNWVRDPKHYNPATYMPNLRLTDQQAADIATYLMTLKAVRWRRGESHVHRQPGQRRLARLLQGRDAVRTSQGPGGEARATEQAGRSGAEGDQPLRLLQLSRYQGLRKAQSIGTDLSEEGSKLVTRLDFAFISDIPHSSKIEWFRTQAPRSPSLRPRAACSSRKKSSGCRTSISATLRSSTSSRPS